MKIVIAGKNQCAVDVHKYFKNKYPQHELIGVPNSDDNVNDGWQPSYKKYLLKTSPKQFTNFSENSFSLITFQFPVDQQPKINRESLLIEYGSVAR